MSVWRHRKDFWKFLKMSILTARGFLSRKFHIFYINFVFGSDGANMVLIENSTKNKKNNGSSNCVGSGKIEKVPFKVFIISLFPFEQIQVPRSSLQTFAFISKKTSVPLVSPARSSSKSIWFELAIGPNEKASFVIGGLSVGLFVEVARNWSIEIIAGWGNAQFKSFGIHLHSFALKIVLKYAWNWIEILEH